MIREYEEKKEELITAVVLLVDPNSGNATLEIGKVPDGALPQRAAPEPDAASRRPH